MPKGLQNTAAGPTVFSDPNSKLVIEWAPAGHPSGQDIRMVPDHLLEDINLMNTISRGILVEVEAEKAKAAAKSGGEAWAASRQAAATAHLDAIDNKTEDDMISVPCQGPGHGPDDPAGRVIVQAGKVSEAPPLCAAHAHLAEDFEVVSTSSGKRRWARKDPAAV